MAVIIRETRRDFANLAPTKYQVSVHKDGYFYLPLPKDVALALRQQDAWTLMARSLPELVAEYADVKARYNLLQLESKLVIRYYAKNWTSGQDGHGTGLRIWWGVYRRIDQDGKKPEYFLMPGGMEMKWHWMDRLHQETREMAHTPEREAFFLRVQEQMDRLRTQVKEFFDDSALDEMIQQGMLHAGTFLNPRK